jgi:PHP family Zn ribbon phosphoesterase
MSSFASYYKCALQVNPSSYAHFRGNPTTEEASYNAEILRKCRENNIEVVGLANHGNVDSSESLRELLVNNGIVVFPGFEIMAAEKIHMVCLFPEDRTVSQLNRYLGAMGLDTAERGNETSSLTCLQIAQKVLDEGGFWYAAHITSDNGILRIGKLNTVWQSDLLIAAQIPDSKENIDPNYKNIVNNTDPQYKRSKTPAYINACDIEVPEDLDKETATTLIKMSEPSFRNFVMAFKDPDSRIRLNSEVETGYQSAIRSLKVFGGYLDGLEIEFSDNLVTIIGGRGTGKSTIINFIRYALDMPPKEKQRKKDFDEMIEHNLGTISRIELIIESNAQFGRVYKVIKRYNADPVIEDAEGKVSSLRIEDIVPRIEIYGQNEIVESVRNPELINGIVLRLFTQDAAIQGQIQRAYQDLADNSAEIANAEAAIDADEGESADLPILKEKLRY